MLGTDRCDEIREYLKRRGFVVRGEPELLFEDMWVCRILSPHPEAGSDAITLSNEEGVILNGGLFTEIPQFAQDSWAATTIATTVSGRKMQIQIPRGSGNVQLLEAA
jgi:hypothetical protein